MTPSPGTLHQRIIGNLWYVLRTFVTEQQLGEVFIAPYDIVLDQYNVLEPDIIVVLNENNKIITEKNIKGAPDLLVEIISPTSGYRDKITKKKLYEKFGVKEYWIVEPKDETIEIYSLKDKQFILNQSLTKKETLSSPLLQDFKVNLTAIFPTKQ